jgi:hypothetical protein
VAGRYIKLFGERKRGVIGERERNRGREGKERE